MKKRTPKGISIKQNEGSTEYKISRSDSTNAFILFLLYGISIYFGVTQSKSEEFEPDAFIIFFFFGIPHIILFFAIRQLVLEFKLIIEKDKFIVIDGFKGLRSKHVFPLNEDFRVKVNWSKTTRHVSGSPDLKFFSDNVDLGKRVHFSITISSRKKKIKVANKITFDQAKFLEEVLKKPQ